MNIIFRLTIALLMLVGATAQAALSADSVSAAGWDKLTETQRAEVLKYVAEQKGRHHRPHIGSTSGWTLVLGSVQACPELLARWELQ